MLRLSVGSAGVGNLWGRWVSRVAAGAAILWAAASLPAQPGPVEPRAGVSPLRPEQGPTQGQEAVKLPSEASTNWWTQAQKQLQDSEYQASKAESGALQAPNRAQNLRSWFDESGALTVPRDAASPEAAHWQWGLALQRYGWQGGKMLPVAPATPVAEKNTVTYQRSPLLREWYVNEAAGLKSWFEIKSAPPGSGSSLRLELALRGNTVATMGTGDKAQTVEFRTESGASVIQYSGLKAWDATGRELACTLSLDGEKTVVLNVDAAGAQFPVTIDPLASNRAWSPSYSQEGSLFGTSVSSAGDVNGDGYSDVIVGAPRFQITQSQEGCAFVFLGTATGLSPSASWFAVSNQTDANFGISVAAGDVNGDGYSDIIVGAPNNENGQTDEGRVYVYLGSASGLATTAAWTAEVNQAGALFGSSVASAGDVNGDGYSDVIIGAPGFDNGTIDEGRAYVYLGSASGLSSSPAWTAESDLSSSAFGSPVAPAGDVNGDGFSDVIVSSPDYSDGGRVFVYLGSGSGLASGWAWSSGGAELNITKFGRSAASAGDVNNDGYSDVIIGAAGRAYEFLGSASGLTQNAAWSATGNPDFGFSVSSAGDVNGDGYSDVLVGAPSMYSIFVSLVVWDPSNTYLFEGSPTGLNPSATGIIRGGNDRFGASVAALGDVNGDGLSDVLIGAPGYANSFRLNDANEIGYVSLYYGYSPPRLGVYGAGSIIASGSAATRQNLTDFGSVARNGQADQSVVRTFVIKNEGLEPLRINTATVSNFDFGIAAPAAVPIIIPGFESALLSVRAVPRFAGPVTATVSLTSNDPSNPSYTFSVAATGVNAASSNTGKVDSYTTTTGWLELGIPDSLLPTLGNPAGLGSRGYDPSNTALLMTLKPNNQSRVVGWREDPEMDLPYSSIGPDRVARATFGIYSVPAPGSTPSSDPNALSTVPNFRLRLMQYFVINSMLEVNHNSGNSDPGIRPLAREFAPSTDPTKPSIYTVDLDPVEIPYLLGSSGATVGVQRGVEAIGAVNGLQPDFQYVQGTIALTDSSVGTYSKPVPQGSPAKLYETGTSDYSNNSILLTKFQADRDSLFAGVLSGFTTEPPLTLTKGPNGITVDTTQVPSSKLAVTAVDFLNGNGHDESHPEARLRIDPERLYQVSFRIQSSGPTTNAPQLRLRARTAKFQWTQMLELGGATAVGSEAGRTIAAQALPGTNSQNVDSDSGGQWYHAWLSSPLSSQIRPDVPGTLFDKFPLLMAQPGMGDPSPQSARDLKVGFNIIDTISVGPGNEQEAAHNLNLNRIEIRDYPQVDINQP